MSNRETPTINAGSMADIAFLLLIFFLVTTTLDAEVGIPKMLSDKTEPHITDVNERNVLEIEINANNEIQLEGSEIVPLEKLKQHIVNFIDNGATTDQNGNTCTWCNGKKDSQSSDHPAKAIVVLESSRNTSYKTYIAIHNEINTAYIDLRNDLATSLYGTSFEALVKNYKKDKTNTSLKAKIDTIKEKYPIHISDKEPIK